MFAPGPEIVPLAEIERDEGPPPASPADGLFTTTQRRLLGFLFGQPERAFFLRELMMMTGCGAGATHRELHRLQHAGLIRSTRYGARDYFQADAASPIHGELSSLVRKTVGLAEPLRDAFDIVASGVQLAFAFEGFINIFGARHLELILVAESGRVPDEAPPLCTELAEQRLGRILFAHVMDVAKVRRREWYLASALEQPRVWVFGDETGFAALMADAPGAPL